MEGGEGLLLYRLKLVANYRIPLDSRKSRDREKETTSIQSFSQQITERKGRKALQRLQKMHTNEKTQNKGRKEMKGMSALRMLDGCPNDVCIYVS